MSIRWSSRRRLQGRARFALLGGLLENSKERCSFLGSGEAKASVENKERDALDTKLSRLREICFHVGEEAVLAQRSSNFLAIESHLGCDLDQARDPTNVFAALAT
jgi:hypothetical protein